MILNKTFGPLLVEIKELLFQGSVNNLVKNCNDMLEDIKEFETDPCQWFNSKTLEPIVTVSMEYISTLNILGIYLYTRYDYNEVVEGLVEQLSRPTGDSRLLPNHYLNLLTDVGDLRKILTSNSTITTMMLLYIVSIVNNPTVYVDANHNDQ